MSPHIQLKTILELILIQFRKKNELTFLWPKWPVWDPLFDPKNPPKKFMWVPFCVLSQEMRHINFLSGGPKWGGLGGGQKVYVEKVYVLFSVPYFDLHGSPSELNKHSN